MERARRRCRQEWREIIERWGSSGLTGVEYARREGLNPNTFAWWRSELGRELAAPPLKLVPVRLPRVRDEPLEVVLPGGITVRVPESADLDRVAALTRAVLGR